MDKYCDNKSLNKNTLLDKKNIVTNSNISCGVLQLYKTAKVQ